MEPLEVAVCDDDLDTGKNLAYMVEKALSGFCKYKIFSNGQELLCEVEKGEYFDIVFMDIEWNGCEEGIKVAKELYRLCPHTGVIYVTGFTLKYVQEIFLSKVNLKGFLMKPISMNTLKQNLECILKEKSLQTKRGFSFLQNREKIILPYVDISYLESSGHKIYIC